MTTLKPQLVRADTLDLQDPDAPSAKDHTRQPTHPNPFGYGPAAPHQAQTLRHAEEEAYLQQKTSPRSSEEHIQGGFGHNQAFYDDPEEDDHYTHINGANGLGDHDRDYDDGDGQDSHDEDMDDDMMDKISSSPSIEDGNYPFPIWPLRADSVGFGVSTAPLSTPTRGLLIPKLVHSQEMKANVTSHHGKYAFQSHSQQEFRPLDFDRQLTTYDDPFQEDSEFQCETDNTMKYLLPVNDPLLDNVLDQTEDQQKNHEIYWSDQRNEIEGYYSDSDNDDDVADDFHFTNDDRFLDSGWGGECLREVEDIDFEFVYALHTFVATVEGQANATKGDTMVLLDDSNSYWWLVRIVKDGSIGYLPAEHIETPTERLARLNKHRNIDLSASMLGDNPEKSKNPLKKAMRRRNAKTVQFSAPTYYEPSDYGWSDEEDMEDSQLESYENGAVDAGHGQDQQTTSLDQKTREEPGATVNGNHLVPNEEQLEDDEPTSPIKVGPDPQMTENQPAETISRSRKGVVRNTDSFFKDDTVETKKISLTPRLLRGDSDSTASTEQEPKQRPSLDTFDKVLAATEKPKEEKKKKEKKGMLSGLFKKKDKSAKSARSEQDDNEKTSEELSRNSTQSKDSMESLSRSDTGPERKPSKLQKQPPSLLSPKNSPTESRAPTRDFPSAVQGTQPPAPLGAPPAPPTIQQVNSETEEKHVTLQTEAEPPMSRNRFPSLSEKRSNAPPTVSTVKVVSPDRDELESAGRVNQSKSTKERFTLDDSDSEDDSTPKAMSREQLHGAVSPLSDSLERQRSLDSPVPISPADPHFMSDDETGSRRKHDPQARSSPFAETTPIESETTGSTAKTSPSIATHTPSTSRSTPTWSDASLRTYMDNSQDIKDLLIIVHDKSNIAPVGPDHPLMSNLFSNERNKLADMQSQLDSMLMTWMSKKNTPPASR